MSDNNTQEIIKKHLEYVKKSGQACLEEYAKRHPRSQVAKNLKGGRGASMSNKTDAEVILEAHQHPERFCPICWKRIGVCKHTQHIRGN